MWTRKPDWEICEDVREGLYWDPCVNSEEVNVSVDEGVVYLAGTVDTWLERRLAESHAWKSGADDVTNGLNIRSSDCPYDLAS
jgi:osmotically-inducible protein OsmY